MKKFITDTKKETLEKFFSGHTQPEAGLKQHYENFSVELKKFCICFFEEFGNDSDRLLSEFLGTCRADYEKQVQDNGESFNLPFVGRGNCLYDTPDDRAFVNKYGFDELEKDLEIAATKLTDAINEELGQTKAAYLTGHLQADISAYNITHGFVNNDGCHLDLRLFFNNSKTLCSQDQIACLLALKDELELDSLELAKDFLAVFLITHYKTELTSTVYSFSSKSSYTCRHLRGIQGAYKKIANALTAVNRASKNGNEPEEDAIKNLNEISANFAAILNMTPVFGNTEGESS